MNNEITIDYNGEYVHAQHYGESNYEISLNLWQQIADSCRKHDCHNILGESFIVNTLTTQDSFDHVKIFEKVGITRKYRIAWVAHIKETAEGIKFVETVLKNRHMAQGHVFANVEEARKWLMEV